MITARCTPTQVTGGTAAGVAVRLAVVRLAAAQLAAAQLAAAQLAAQQVAARLAVARLAVARLAAARLVCSAHLMAEQLAVRFAAVQLVAAVLAAAPSAPHGARSAYSTGDDTGDRASGVADMRWTRGGARGQQGQRARTDNSRVTSQPINSTQVSGAGVTHIQAGNSDAFHPKKLESQVAICLRWHTIISC